VASIGFDEAILVDREDVDPANPHDARCGPNDWQHELVVDDSATLWFVMSERLDDSLLKHAALLIKLLPVRSRRTSASGSSAPSQDVADTKSACCPAYRVGSPGSALEDRRGTRRGSHVQTFFGSTSSQLGFCELRTSVFVLVNSQYVPEVHKYKTDATAAAKPQLGGPGVDAVLCV
jgi:hypothetical protein